MKRIALKNGDFAKVDDEDFEKLSKFTWCLDSKGYAFRHFTSGGKQTRIKMHREVLGLKGKFPLADHRDCDRLNNQKHNLRQVTYAQNSANRLIGVANTSGYKGVTWNKQSRKWQAGIKKDGKSKHLGLFEDPKEAHAAYCEAAKELFGEFANKGDLA
jgi:hypothetical protein